MTFGGVGGGPEIVEKRLEWRNRGLNLVGRINTSPRYVIDITGTDLLCLKELGGG